MIKIIEEGKIKYRGKCYRCGCVFDYNAEDVTRYVESNGFACCTIICPYCDQQIFLHGANIKENEFGLMKTIKVEEIS